MRDAVRASRCLVTFHAEEEMEKDDLKLLDIERAVFTGQIVGRQIDRKTGERKYLVRGRAIDDGTIIVVVKLNVAGELVIITVYRL